MRLLSWPSLSAGKLLLVAALAAQGFLLLRPGGVLVRAARGRSDDGRDQAADWWRQSPVHMGCSIPSCKRPATRIATYRQWTPRGATWRAYGFCDRHSPPGEVTGLVYRLGRPASIEYDVPLTPFWTEIYFLLGALGFSVWCAVMWRSVSGKTTLKARILIVLLNTVALTVLSIY